MKRSINAWAAIAVGLLLGCSTNYEPLDDGSGTSNDELELGQQGGGAGHASDEFQPREPAPLEPSESVDPEPTDPEPNEPVQPNEEPVEPVEPVDPEPTQPPDPEPMEPQTPRDCGSNARTPFELTVFERAEDELSCFGDQYVAYLEGHQLYLGVQLCGAPTTYRLYLSANENGMFLPATDTAGHGQDHCELLNPSFTAPNEDDITSGGCASCTISQNLPIEYQPAFHRGYADECFEPIQSTGVWSYQTSQLSCGVSVP
jgi:hypothetical protein